MDEMTADPGAATASSESTSTTTETPSLPFAEAATQAVTGTAATTPETPSAELAEDSQASSATQGNEGEFAIDEDAWAKAFADDAPEALPSLEQLGDLPDEQKAIFQQLQERAQQVEQFAPIQQAAEYLGGVERTTQLVNALAVGLAGNEPAYDADGEPLGVSSMGYTVRQLNDFDPTYLDGLLQEGVRYAPEAIASEMPTLLEFATTDPKAPPQLKAQIEDWFEKTAAERGYEVAFDTAKMAAFTQTLSPERKAAFDKLSLDERKDILERPRGIAETDLDRAARLNAVEEANAKALQQQQEQAAYQAEVKASQNYANTLDSLYMQSAQKLQKLGFDELRAEGLAARAYRNLERAYWNEGSPEAQVMRGLMEAQRKGQPQVIQKQELAIRKLFHQQLERLTAAYRKPAAPKAAAATAAPNAPRQQAPQFTPDSPQRGTAISTEDSIAQLMAQYGFNG